MTMGISRSIAQIDIVTGGCLDDEIWAARQDLDAYLRDIVDDFLERGGAAEVFVDGHLRITLEAEPSIRAGELVLCENADHNGGYVNRQVPLIHEMDSRCLYPHLVAPQGIVPAVGHPLTVHD